MACGLDRAVGCGAQDIEIGRNFAQAPIVEAVHLAARSVLRVAAAGTLGHGPHMRDVGERLAHRAKANRDTVVRFAGPHAADMFDALPSKPAPVAEVRLPRG